MSDVNAPNDNVVPAAMAEDQAIRERVRELTSQVLQQGRVDPAGVSEVVRAVTGLGVPEAGVASATSRQAIADAVGSLDATLQQAASATHLSLERLASRGKDFTDNDLKDVLVSLKGLEVSYVAVATRIADAMSGNLRSEMAELAIHAQSVGADASARVATLMGEFAGRMGDSATAGLETMRGASVRTALLGSGILAGVADALREQAAANKSK